MTSPYLKSFVVARINPIRFRPRDAAPLSYNELLERMTKAVDRFNPEKIRMEDLAKSGGAPEESLGSRHGQDAFLDIARKSLLVAIGIFSLCSVWDQRFASAIAAMAVLVFLDGSSAPYTDEGAKRLPTQMKFREKDGNWKSFPLWSEPVRIRMELGK